MAKVDPNGPIYIDFTDMLLQLPVGKLLHCANLALNLTTSRQLAEIAYDLGVGLEMRLVEKAEDAPASPRKDE